MDTMRFTGNRPPRIALSAALLLCSGVALTREASVIEEIIVTAQRVEQDASKVPIAVTAFTEPSIKDRQIVGLHDLHLKAPNVTFAPRTVAPIGDLTIRGISIPDGGPSENFSGTAISLHINEIPFPQSFASVEFYDVERIELMRGPQGTLFGRNATAGALNVLPRRPRVDGLEGYLELEYGDYDHRRIMGALNVPLSEAFAFRVAGTGLKRDGYIENRAGGQVPEVDADLDGRNQYAVRASALWQISESAELWVMVDHFDERARVRVSAPATGSA